MKYLSLVFVLSLLVTACQSQEEKDKSDLTKTIRTTIENEAFKENKKIELLTIQVVSYEKLDKKQVDTLRRFQYSNLISYYSSVGTTYFDLVHTNVDIIKNAIELEDRSTVETYRRKMNENQAKGSLYLDSAQYFAAKDSIIALSLKKAEVLPKDFYKAKFYCKSTIGGSNTLDTLYWIIDKDFQRVDLSK